MSTMLLIWLLRIMPSACTVNLGSTQVFAHRGKAVSGQSLPLLPLPAPDEGNGQMGHQLPAVPCATSEALGSRSESVAFGLPSARGASRVLIFGMLQALLWPYIPAV